MAWIRLFSMAAVGCLATLTVASAQTAAVVSPTPASCTAEIPAARLGASPNTVLQLDPNTTWRPFGTEVRFTISSASGSQPVIKQVSACFRWETSQAPGAAAGATPAAFIASPFVRSIPNNDGVIEYGAFIPTLHSTGALVQRAAFQTVPLADMQVLVQLDNNQWVAAILPVGITYVPSALIVLLICLLIAACVLWCCAPAQLLYGAKGFGMRSISRHLLALISTPDGVASLSQFQVMLWTFVVAGSAIYVMVLSGNLISVSDGTLTLLGIAGGTAILARIPPKGNPPLPPPPACPPQWSQMLADNNTQEIDVTRVQMLMFTLITAVFVSIQVATSYSIPEIPPNFLILMGISNGVYLAGRQTPPPQNPPLQIPPP